jgi:hypothetical protein
MRLNDKSKVRVINGNHIKYVEDVIGMLIWRKKKYI